MKNSIPFLPDVDISLACFDCEVPLDLVSSWEPCLRLDTQTGEAMHVPICASCIGHLDEVYTHDVLRVIFKLAKRYRRRRDKSAFTKALVSVTYDSLLTNL